jgi:hypothetical protein
MMTGATDRKALAQAQLAMAGLDPELDSFEVAGSS